MKKNINLILVIIWMIIIFIMSSFNGNDSSMQSNFIVNIISNIFNIKNIELLSLIVRKLAHFSEYFILGILICRYINDINKLPSLTLLIGSIYALSDEIHQIYVPGRSFAIRDILIDTLGIILSIIIYKIIKKHIKV